ncbi:MAG: hypothetical protein AW07_02878 [Candidatus Accumulibacter sp. SK-11]|nr:MAG: hypothetical protein AW07_02878 [Candidatus Accumulibacter sp. SK-11]
MPREAELAQQDRVGEPRVTPHELARSVRFSGQQRFDQLGFLFVHARPASLSPRILYALRRPPSTGDWLRLE